MLEQRVIASLGVRLMLVLSMVISGVALAAPVIASEPMPPSPDKAASAQFDPSKEENWIPYDGAADDQIIIPVTINGETVRALVDTGMPEVGLDIGWARRHHLPLQSGSQISGAGGLTAQEWTTPIASMGIGAFYQTGGFINVIDLAGITAAGGRKPFDVIVGFSFLSQVAVDIDTEQHRVRFRHSGVQPPVGHAVPLLKVPGMWHFFTSLSLQGKGLSSVMIDTGNNGGLSILKSAYGAYPPAMRLTDLMSVGLGGVVVEDYALSDRVHWGDQAVSGVPTDFEDHPLDNSYAALIGMEFLENWNIFIDSGKGVMVLSDRKKAPPPAYTTNMGIQGDITDAGWVIDHVMKNSPAKAIGLKDGDRICSVDGRKLKAGAPTPRGPDGSEMVLSLCDGRQLKLVRSKFY